MGITEHLFFDGVDLNDFGALPIIGNIYASAERVYETVSVPGRSGDLLLDGGRYANITRSYDVIFAGAAVREQAAALRTFLTSRVGYRRIEDTLHPDEFCVGFFRGGLASSIETVRQVRYTLEFACKPQRWLKSGEIPRHFTAHGVIVNPETTEARPLVRVYGAGTVTINGTTVTVAESANTFVDIDSETEDCTCGEDNCNDLVTLTDFPALSPGENVVIPGAGVSRVVITPRWWRL